MCSEVKSLCKKGSVFTLDLKSALNTVTWEDLLDIVQSKAPILSSIISSTLSRVRSRTTPTLSLLASFSVILKTRSPTMSSLPRIIALILYAGHSGKEVSCDQLYY